MARKFNPLVRMGFDDTGDAQSMTAAQIRDQLQTLTGANRLDATYIQNIPSGGGGITEITYAAAIAAMAASTLTPGTLYLVTDENVLFQAVSTSEFAKDGIRWMYCPTDYVIHTDVYNNVWKGIWSDTKSVSIGDLVIWGALVWRNLTGEIGTANTQIELDETNWLLIPSTSFTNHEYTLCQFGINFNWNYEEWDFHFLRQWDHKGNVISGLYPLSEGDSFVGANPFNNSDWNGNVACNVVAGFFNNHGFLINNFSPKGIIYDNYANISDCTDFDGIYSNIISYNGAIMSIGSVSASWITHNECNNISNVVAGRSHSGNYMLSGVTNNICPSIQNCNCGSIHGNEITGLIEHIYGKTGIIQNSGELSIYNIFLFYDIYQESAEIPSHISDLIGTDEIVITPNA